MAYLKLIIEAKDAGIGLDRADFLLAQIENVNLIVTGDVNLIFQGGRNEKQ